MAKFHIAEVLRAAVAEAAGEGDLFRRLHAMAKLRLISMPNEEIWELSDLMSSPLGKPVESTCQEIKQAIEKHRETVDEWRHDLVGRPLAEENKENEL